MAPLAKKPQLRKPAARHRVPPGSKAASAAFAGEIRRRYQEFFGSPSTWRHKLRAQLISRMKLDLRHAGDPEGPDRAAV